MTGKADSTSCELPLHCEAVSFGLQSTSNLMKGDSEASNVKHSQAGIFPKRIATGRIPYACSWHACGIMSGTYRGCNAPQDGVCLAG